MVEPSCPYEPPSGFLRGTNLTRFCPIEGGMIERWRWDPGKNCWEYLGTKTKTEWDADARRLTYGY